jgi:hypothetical protein
MVSVNGKRTVRSIKELTEHLSQDPLAVLKTQYVLGGLPPREAPWIRGLGIDVFFRGGENMKSVSKRRLKKEFQALQQLNDSFSDFINEINEKYPLDQEEKKKIESMQLYFKSTKSLFLNMEQQC